jgi:hypothetical protein
MMKKLAIYAYDVFLLSILLSPSKVKRSHSMCKLNACIVIHAIHVFKKNVLRSFNTVIYIICTEGSIWVEHDQKNGAKIHSCISVS